MKNSAAACRDFCSLGPMLPLVSKTSPIEIGASSLEKSVMLLLDFVFEKPEMLLLEPCDKAVQRIGHRDIDQHQRPVDPDVYGLELPGSVGTGLR